MKTPEEALLEYKTRIVDAYIDWYKMGLIDGRGAILARTCLETVLKAEIIRNFKMFKITEFYNKTFEKLVKYKKISDSTNKEFTLSVCIEALTNTNLIIRNNKIYNNIKYIQRIGNKQGHGKISVIKFDVDETNECLLNILNWFFTNVGELNWVEELVKPRLQDMYSKISQDISNYLTPIVISQIKKYLNEISEKNKPIIKKGDEIKEEAIRRWQYIQSHAIKELKIRVFLKSPVGYQWLINLLNNVELTFFKNTNTFYFSNILKDSPEPNTINDIIDSKVPIFSFWEMYKLEDGYWCKRIDQKKKSFNVLAGFEVIIPWEYLNLSKIINLQDLTICNDFAISFPPEIFQAGIEEVIINISGETYSFSMNLSEESPMEIYHSMASQYLRSSLKNSSMSFNISGVRILDLFYKKSMPEYERNKEKDGIIIGQSGPAGNHIYFYPSIPKSFQYSEEDKEFTFTIPSVDEIDYEKIETELKNKLEQNKDDINSYINLAKLYMTLDRLPETIKLLTSNYEVLKQNYLYYGILATAYGKLGRYNEAINNFEKAISLNSTDHILYANLSRCFERIGNNETAINHLKDAIKLQPTDAAYYYDLSRNLKYAQKEAEAITYAKKAVELEPHNAEYCISLGMLLAKNGDIDRAYYFLKKALEIDSTSSKAHKYYALILAAKGEIEEAIRNYENSINIEKDIECYSLLARLLCNKERWNDAEPVINEGLKMEENNIDLLICLGVLNANQGKLIEALEVFQKVCLIDSQNEDAKEYIRKVKLIIKNKESM